MVTQSYHYDREASCPCGSGKQYIDCCWWAGQYPPLFSKAQIWGIALAIVSALILIVSILQSASFNSDSSTSRPSAEVSLQSLSED